MIKLKQFTFNAFQVNCYVLYDETNECVIIDASCYTRAEKDELKQFIAEKGLKPIHLLNTHCHIDHILGNYFISDTYNIFPEAHEGEKMFVDAAKQYGQSFGFDIEGPVPIQKFLIENQLISIGNSSIKTIHVPGHSPGSICYYAESEKLLISGDVLFNNSIGRSDLPGGNHEQLIIGIREKLLSLNDDVAVYPGHGEHTSIGNEKWSNPYF
ncbi:MAG: MBL fold hydrolase [Bacteroidetes bacterium GWF2_33_38]|nr:MAG: MBL fold hydrolase [Bacteroidetes bacterium GWF2_33_38]OFY68976.1 MAG: MBL fold hydrolase [Bacteroidetes bacterium RIFOXYA12_FULL_33_9]OFY92085.1 MAG: MBL fold hydrolase [Bacteroidetes bacterium RIFOXYA2_FULL_33_7]HBX52634.1 MBL fold hydrolase [Bacteroidales bacterium]